MFWNFAGLKERKDSFSVFVEVIEGDIWSGCLKISSLKAAAPAFRNFVVEEVSFQS